MLSSNEREIKVMQLLNIFLIWKIDRGDYGYSVRVITETYMTCDKSP